MKSANPLQSEIALGSGNPDLKSRQKPTSAGLRSRYFGLR